MNKFPYTLDNKRYHTLYYHNRVTYGGRIHKAVIDAGFTCPNIDGKRGRGGCIFCGGGSGYFTAPSALSVRRQLELEKERLAKKYPDVTYSDIIAYFQAHTNTYADCGTLSSIFGEAASMGVRGLAVATRADCLDREKVLLLKSFGENVTVELGLQSIFDTTAEKINRCGTYSEFLSSYDMLRENGIRVCVHLINGLPGEDAGMMLETARTVGRLRPDAVKLHLLHVIRGTPLCTMWENGQYTPLTKEMYTDIVVSQLELLPPETVIERVTGDGDKRFLAAPDWSRDKLSVLGGIDRRMSELDTWQGRSFGK